MAKQVPDMVKKTRGEDVSPDDIGPPNAEPKGVWRVLRNGIVLTVCLFVALFIGYAVL